MTGGKNIARREMEERCKRLLRDSGVTEGQSEREREKGRRRESKLIEKREKRIE